MGRSDSLHVLGPASLWFAGPYLPVRLSSYSPRPERRPGGLGPLGAAAPGPLVIEEERQGLSSSRGTLVCLCRVLGPRRERVPLAVGKDVVAPASGNNKGSPRVRQSRGSIARPEHWLSTLRPRPYGAEDARLASGCGPGLPGGIGYPQGSYERFP